MVKIAFHNPQIDVRGTCSALYDYAHYNEILLNNQSIIIIPNASVLSGVNDQIAVEKFQNRVNVIFYEDNDSLQKILDSENCDIIYVIKYGRKDNFIFKNIKNCVHCVFDMSEPHGDIYAGVSSQIAMKYGKSLFVPHMVGLKPSMTTDNLRDELGIPTDAIVFGRYGGLDTFNIKFCRETISKVVRNYNNIYFIFINTPEFDNHPQIIFLSKIIKDEDKNKFILTCDAHLECGTLGHTFGLAIGEFSINNKPIITYGGWTWNDSHKHILQDKAIYYYNEEEFYKILTEFDKKEYEDKDLNFYKDYSPKKVMTLFKEVFIDN